LCAGLLIKLIQSFSPAPIETDDLGAAMLGFYRDGASNVREVIASGVTGRKLLKMGLKKDLEACCQIDKLNAVPKLHGDCLTLEPASS
jgi:2-phosphosulfolactate phosphatase